MSSEAIGWVFKHSPLKGVAFTCHLAIADTVNAQYDYRFWMSMDTLAKTARCSRRSAIVAVQEMENAGLVQLLKDSKGGASNTKEYKFLMPELCKDVTVTSVHSSEGTVQSTTGTVQSTTGTVQSLHETVQSLHTNPIEPKKNPKRNPTSYSCEAEPHDNTKSGDNSTISASSPISSTINTGEPSLTPSVTAAAPPVLGIPNTESMATLPGIVTAHPTLVSSNGKGKNYDAEVAQVFAAWQQIMDKPRAKMSGARAWKIRARLKEGFTVDDLISAIRGVRANAWMMGDNDQGKAYNDLVSFLADASRVERHIENDPQRHASEVDDMMERIRAKRIARGMGR